MMNNFGLYDEESHGLKTELSKDLAARVVAHRNRFARILYHRYLELLPLLIKCKNVDLTSIDYLKLEVGLRSNFNVVIGQATNGKHMILGYTNRPNGITNPSLFFQNKVLKKNDITFTVPKHLIPEKMIEITNFNDCETGNFVVLQNKVLNYTNDLEIIQHYTAELAEIVLSRYSLTMQAKLMTFFKGEIGDETTNQLVNSLYNGDPFPKVSKFFDTEEQMITFDNTGLASNLVELKREYQNKLSELNNMIGLNSLAVEKASGVSDTEAKSNRAFTTGNSNIYIQARQEPLTRYNKRFGLQLKVEYDDDVSSELSSTLEVLGNE